MNPFGTGRSFHGQCKKQGTGVKIQEIQWVLTIPAIWTDAAKQFMRECAEKASIPPEKLLLALEPETASIFCQYLPTEKLHGADQTFAMSAEGTRYMVADIGGGTADITVHEKTKDGRLKELHRASGNDCGGTSVDGRFFQMLVKILGGPVMKKIKDEDPAAYLDLFREFDAVKRTIVTGKEGKVNITIPYASLDANCREMLGEDLKAVIASSPYGNEISLRGDKMRIDAHLMINLFKPTVDNIISLMFEILKDKKVQNVTQILLVGGFSECRLIQDAVIKKFWDKKIIIPEEAGLSVLKGAVLFGHRPDYIQSRVLRFTYGVEIVNAFNPITRCQISDGNRRRR
ncbi:heat shock 70 kDa protein 12B-like [Mytilus edulis]|uniref:heat shock 70 kDa protein 12B-like n=1 Tax=Mytilus edulis TaxID=6550 RepID=UPI0039EDF3C7